MDSRTPPRRAARRRIARTLALTAILSLGFGLAFVGSGCATNRMLDASGRGELLQVPNDRDGDPPTRGSIEFVNAAAAFVAFPFTLLFDIVTFPYQIFSGYRPYGTRNWDD